MGGWEAQRKCVSCMQGWCCGFVLDDVDSCRDVPQYKVMKYLVFGIISSSLLSELLFRFIRWTVSNSTVY
jgi:hypothetical protein